jgi:hypothetical protein
MTEAERIEQAAIRKLVVRLSEIFKHTHSADQVGRVVDAHYHRFDGSKVRTFIPLLVEHIAREQLRSPESVGSRPRTSPATAAVAAESGGGFPNAASTAARPTTTSSALDPAGSADRPG